ncbi:MAG: hypothetical protein ACREV1_06005 [Gammaproteobacteria bacterium]
MTGKPFLDTNVVAYALTNELRKKAIAEELLSRCYLIYAEAEFDNVHTLYGPHECERNI